MGVPVYVGDRVLVTAAVTGTSDYTIGSAVTGYLDPASANIATGSRVAYVAVDSLTAPTVFEVGEGIFTNSTTDTISRLTIIATHLGATGTPSAYSWPSTGSKYLFLAPSATRFVMYDSDGNLTLKNTGITGVTNLNDGPLAGFRNAVINGDFDIWQRGTSFSNPAFGDFTADRWFVIYDGSAATRTISRQTFTVGQTSVPDQPRYYLQFNQSGAGSGATYNVLRQRIEGVRTFAGKTITVSFYAKSGASITLPRIEFIQYFGSGGSPSSDVFTTVVTSQNISTSWVKYSYTVSIPSISGKTIGTNNDDDLSFLIYVPINTTFTFDLSHVQIEIGGQATPFERRPFSSELDLCQRYFWKTFPLETAPAQNAGVTGALGFGVLLASGNAAYVGCSFPTRMRRAPDITTYNPSAANAQARNVTNNADFSATSAIANEWGFYFTATAGAWAVGSLSRLHITANAELP